MVEKLYRLHPRERELVQTLAASPSRTSSRGARWPASDVREAQRFAQTPVSLEKPIGDARTPSCRRGRRRDRAYPSTLLPTRWSAPTSARHWRLFRRSRDVIVLRFGLDGKEPLTLEQAGKVLASLGERVAADRGQTLRRVQGAPEAQRPARIRLTFRS